MKLQTLWWVLIGVIVISAGFYIYNDIYSKSVQEVVQNEEIQLEDGLILEEGSQGGITIAPIENKKNTISTPVPDLNQPIIFGDNVSDREKELATEKINKLTKELKKDSSFFSNWIELGLYRKSIGDYAGARDAWKYANVLQPLNFLPYNNLGDLYHFYLKDYPKSEENFQKAIEHSVENTGVYIGLHELYKYSYKQDTTSVVDILLEGIETVENDIDLLITLASYYKERGNIAKGDMVNAKKYYEQAREKAQKLGNTQLIEAITQEISNL
ncbi:hypothetical protein HON59_01400 [bacterium]|jgi:tetratricopeptide (TPR) repeat protein|nr:hypothetical protein [bacterium]